MKYKVGDKVRILKKDAYPTSGLCEGIGRVGHIVTNYGDCVRVDSDENYCGLFTENELEMVGNEKIEKKSTIKNTMKKLNNLFKKLTDPSVQSLSEAGILNGDLELTEEGKNELLGILFLENKDALVKRAEEIIQEAKAEKE